jgi:hypothetical protein
MKATSKRAQLFHKLSPAQLKDVINGLELHWSAQFEKEDADLAIIRPTFLLLQQAKRERDERPANE